MRFFSAAALLSAPFLTNAAPVEGPKGHEMGLFYVNWVRITVATFRITY